ncbi:MAG: hypothetical protein U0Z44_21635 [Kouleothrix sp.]
MRAALDRQGGGMLINASRSIMYVRRQRPDFAEAARFRSLRLRDAINAAIEPAPGSQQ